MNYENLSNGPLVQPTKRASYTEKQTILRSSKKANIKYRASWVNKTRFDLFKEFVGIARIFRRSDALGNFLAQSATFSEKNFPTLTEFTAVSDITSTTLCCMKVTSRILKLFRYDYFEDLLTARTFVKKIGFPVGVVSKIFAIENALQSKNQYCVMHLEKVIYYVTLLQQSRTKT